jgi:F-type H+-transporting ATPase subunit b
MEFFHEFFGHAENWVLVSFILFLALLAYLKVPALIGKSLDDRSAKIAKELNDAKTLRQEAEALLAEYKKKRSDAEKEAADIITAAKSEAQAYSADSARKLTEMLTRRQAQAEAKIAQAEAAAVKDVRAAATDIATAAAAHVLAKSSKGKAGDSLIAESITAVKSRLN